MAKDLFFIQSLRPNGDPPVPLVVQSKLEERILVWQERKAVPAGSMYSTAVRRKQPLFSERDLAEWPKSLSV